MPRPNASAINYVAGVNGANEIIARLGGAGQLCVYTSTNSHFILDVVGYVKPNADLSISKNDNVSAVIVGDTITYTVEAINNGPGHRRRRLRVRRPAGQCHVRVDQWLRRGPGRGADVHAR